MALTIKEGKTFEPVPAGMHYGICTWLYDCGTQETDFNGKKKKQQHVIISWELPDVRIDVDVNGTTFNLPRMFSKEFNASLDKRATLRKILDGWRGTPFTKEQLQGFDLRNILNKCCLLQIIHQEKEDGSGIKPVLQSVVPLMAGMTGKTPETEVRFFEFGTSTEIPEGTPEWILNRLKEAEEWGQFGKTLSGGDEPKKPAFMNEAVAPPATTNGELDDIPF